MICPIIADSVVEVPEYNNSRFMVMEDNESTIRPIGASKNLSRDSFSIVYPKYHKFWVIANKNEFKSAASESDLADPNNLVGVGCFINENHDSKYFIFNINDTLFYGPAIFPDGGSHVKLQTFNVKNDWIPDFKIIKDYLNDISGVEYWDFKKHA